MKKYLWLSPSSMNVEPIIGSFECNVSPFKNAVDSSTYYYDKSYPPNDAILSAVETYKPDVVFYISVSGGPFQPQPRTFCDIRSSGTQVVHICFDASCPDWHPQLTAYNIMQCFDLTINIDGNPNWPHDSTGMTTLAPIDPRPFFEAMGYPGIPLIDRPIPLGFAGGTASPDREKLISELKQELTIHPRDEKMGSYKAFADFMMRCKATLNMPACGSGKAMQVKARVIEAALAGTILFEHKDSMALKYFSMGEDFLVYESAEDIKSILPRLQGNGLLDGMVKNLRQKVLDLIDPGIYWDTVFRKLS